MKCVNSSSVFFFFFSFAEKVMGTLRSLSWCGRDSVVQGHPSVLKTSQNGSKCAAICLSMQNASVNLSQMHTALLMYKKRGWPCRCVLVE